MIANVLSTVPILTSSTWVFFNKQPRKTRITNMLNTSNVSLGALVCQRYPLDLRSLAEFLAMTVDDIRSALQYVHSLGTYPGAGRHSGQVLPSVVPRFCTGQKTLPGQKISHRCPFAGVHYGAALYACDEKAPIYSTCRTAHYAYMHWASHLLQ